jgi:inner membrane protein
MTARTHDLAAVTALGVALLVAPIGALTLSTALVSLLANQIGGIIPDIDQPTAPLWRNLPIGRLFGKVIDRLIGGHRYLSHSLLGAVIFAVLANLLLHFLHPIMPHVDIKLVWYAFIIGLLSHLIMDTLTKEGVPWLLPIPWKIGLPPIKALRITTGKYEETLLIFPGLLAADIWLCMSHYTQLAAFIHQHLIK